MNNTNYVTLTGKIKILNCEEKEFSGVSAKNGKAYNFKRRSGQALFGTGVTQRICTFVLTDESPTPQEFNKDYDVTIIGLETVNNISHLKVSL